MTNAAPSILPAVDDDVGAGVDVEEQVREDSQHLTPAIGLCSDHTKLNVWKAFLVDSNLNIVTVQNGNV